MSKRTLDITNEVEFEGTMLRNGILSLSDEMKLANDYDQNIKSASDSLFEKDQDFSLSENLDELVEPYPEPRKDLGRALKVLQLKLKTSHDDVDCDYSFGNKTCLCFYKTSTPVRLEFNSYDELIIPEVVQRKVVRLQSTQDNLEELRNSDELLEAALATSIAGQASCSPGVKRSLQKIRRTSKKGAITVLTAVLSNIV